MIRPYITLAFKGLGRLGVPLKEGEKEVVGERGRRRGRLGRVEQGRDSTEGERRCMLAGLTCDDTSYYWMFKICFLIIAKAYPVNYFVTRSCRSAARSLFPAVF